MELARPAADSRALGSLGIVGQVLLSRRSPCTEHDAEALCISDITFDDFLTALGKAAATGPNPVPCGWRWRTGHSSGGRRRSAGWTAPRRFELTSGAPSETGQRKGILFALSAGEVWTRET